jgi:hypothetical protein
MDLESNLATSSEHHRLSHLTTIMGNAQLVQRRLQHGHDLSPVERERVLRQLLAIERAARTLQHGETARSCEPQQRNA